MIFIYLTIKVLGTGLRDKYQANIKISGDDYSYEGKTYNGELSICLEKNKAYKLEVSNLYKRVNTIIYVNNENTFIINLNNYRIITFLLTDYYYDNLPIKKGEIILG